MQFEQVEMSQFAIKCMGKSETETANSNSCMRMYMTVHVHDSMK